MKNYYSKTATVHWYLLLFIMFCSSCNTTQYLSEEEYLLRENKVIIETEADEKETGDLAYQLKFQAKQKPNKKWLFVFRPRLWWYYKAQEHIADQTTLDTLIGDLKRDTSLFYQSILRRYAEPPMIYDSLLTDISIQQMEYKLNNKGFYHPKVEAEVRKKNKKAQVIYRITTNDVMRIRNITYTTDDDSIRQYLSALEKGSLLKDGNILEKSTFNQEKGRITKTLKDKGYKDFYPNYVLYEGDSTNNRTEVTVHIARPSDTTFHQKFYTNNIYVHVEYQPSERLQTEYDTIFQGGYHFIVSKDEKPFVKLKTLSQLIDLEKGKLFQQRRLEKTTRQISQLGIYKFIRVKETRAFVKNGRNVNDYNIYLTPSKTMAFQGNVDLNYVTGDEFFLNNDIVGLGFSGTLMDKNIFRSGENLVLNAGKTLEYTLPLQDVFNRETPITNDNRFRTDLYFPNPIENYKRRLTTSYSNTKRQRLFDNRRITLAYGQDFVVNNNLKLSVNYPSFSYVEYSLDSTFMENIGEDPRYNSQAITGASLIVDYKKVNQRRKRTVALRVNADVAGALIGSFIDPLINPDASFTFGENDIPYAHYGILELDFSYTKALHPDLSFAFRVNSGYGKSFENSLEIGIPYTEQFFVGGANSIRGWRERQLGPGGNTRDIVLDENQIFFNTGDFKFQVNSEVRFNMDALFEGLKGAYFTDFGNVWMLKGETPDDVRVLRQDNFAKRFAVASGMGLRLDLSFVVIRFDYGVKIRRSYGLVDADGNEPLLTFWEYFPSGNNFNLRDGQAQFGIGYPF